jgi:type I restriction enzyme S subunit
MTPGHFREEGGFRDQGQKTKYYTGTKPDGYLLNEGELLVAMTEQKLGLIGSPAFVPCSNKYLHNQRLGLVENLNRNLDKNFLFYLLNTNLVRTELSKTSTGSKVKHTSPSKIQAVIVAVPTEIIEQKEIAHILQTIDQKIEIHEKKKSTLQDLFKTMLHKLMTAEIRVHDLDIDTSEVV